MILNKLKQAWQWIKRKTKRAWKFILLVLGVGIVIAAPITKDAIAPDRSFENLSNVQKISETFYKITYDEYSEVEIGTQALGAKIDEFRPNVKLKKWGDETWIKIGLSGIEFQTPKQKDGKLKWKYPDKEVHLYPLEPNEQMEGGGFEYEVILKEKPATNVISLDIETQGLKFYYQPALAKEDYSNIDIDYCIPTDCYKDGEVVVHRPENIIGSYAVYHSTKRDHIVGQKDYKTGLAFHIYRPKIIDANGWEIWGSLNNDKKVLSVEIPQDFLDNAVYPIRHAVGATLGYTTAGSSSIGIDNTFRGVTATASENGTITDLRAYGDPLDGQDNNILIYPTAGGTYLDKGSSCYSTGGAAWQTKTDTNSGALVNGTSYYIGVWSDGGSPGDSLLYYNSGCNGGTYSYAAAGCTQDTTPSWSADNQCYSAYVTYTPAASSRRIIITE